MGKSVINWGGVTVPNLSEDSLYPLQTNVATKEFNAIKNSRASLSTYGMTKLSTANDITDANSYALSAVEKNTSISGTLANQLQSATTFISNFIIPIIIPTSTPHYIVTDGNCYSFMFIINATNGGLTGLYLLQGYGNGMGGRSSITPIKELSTITITSEEYIPNNYPVEKIQLKWNNANQSACYGRLINFTNSKIQIIT